MLWAPEAPTDYFHSAFIPVFFPYVESLGLNTKWRFFNYLDEGEPILKYTVLFADDKTYRSTWPEDREIRFFEIQEWANRLPLINVNLFDPSYKFRMYGYHLCKAFPGAQEVDMVMKTDGESYQCKR